MTDKDRELRDRFKYQKFKLSTDNTIISFDLIKVYKDSNLLGEYRVLDNNGDYKIIFDPLHIGPLINFWIIFSNGDKLLFNADIKTLKIREENAITLTQVPEE